MSKKWYAIVLFILLLLASLLKDELTPDYRNTPNAAFLNPENLTLSRISSITQYPFFWLKAFFYSILISTLAVGIIKLTFSNKALTQLTIIIHVAIVVCLYACIFVQSNTVDVVLVSKINRYLHSPIITMFLWAAFTINQTGLSKNEQ